MDARNKTPGTTDPGSAMAPATELTPVNRTWVLLAEDDQDLRELLARALREDGYEVIEARDGTEVLRWLNFDGWEGAVDHFLDLMVTDVRMPGITGLEILEGLRGSRWRVPVIIISAFADEAMRKEAEKAGASAVLAKPFSLEVFRRTVARLAPPKSSSGA